MTDKSDTRTTASSRQQPWAAIVQLRILNILRKWIELHPSDFQENEQVAQALKCLFQYESSKDSKRNKLYLESLTRKLLKATQPETTAADDTKTVSTMDSAHSANTSDASASTVASSIVTSPVLPANPATDASKPTAESTPSEKDPQIVPKNAFQRMSMTIRGRSKLGGAGTRSALQLPNFNDASKSSHVLSSASTKNLVPQNDNALATTTSTASNATIGDSSRDSSESKSTLTGSTTLSRSGTKNFGTMGRGTTRRSQPRPASIISYLMIQNTAAQGDGGSNAEADISQYELNNFLSFDPEQVFQQLTLYEHRKFKSVKLDEFFCQRWTDKETRNQTAPNITSFIQWFNKVAYGVASEIVMAHSLTSRVSTIKRWIHVAHLALKSRNFNLCFEIVSGLGLSPVLRLARTWRSVPRKYLDVYHNLVAVMNPEQNYRVYRACIRNIQGAGSTTPVLPYLGINLTDLVFAEDGNSTLVTGPEGKTCFATWQQTHRPRGRRKPTKTPSSQQMMTRQNSIHVSTTGTRRGSSTFQSSDFCHVCSRILPVTSASSTSLQTIRLCSTGSSTRWSICQRTRSTRRRDAASLLGTRTPRRRTRFPGYHIKILYM